MLKRLITVTMSKIILKSVDSQVVLVSWLLVIDIYEIQLTETQRPAIVNFHTK